MGNWVSHGSTMYLSVKLASLDKSDHYTKLYFIICDQTNLLEIKLESNKTQHPTVTKKKLCYLLRKRIIEENTKMGRLNSQQPQT